MREQEALPPAANGTNARAPNAAALVKLSQQELANMAHELHPLDHCRADKRLPPLMLQPLCAPVMPEQRLPGVDSAPWRELFVGYVFLDGTDVKKRKDGNDKQGEQSSVTLSGSIAASNAPDDLADHVEPPSTFAHEEDPLNPSHDLLLAVGSQVLFEIRSRLFYTLGYTTSAAVAPNCMLAKVASSLNKPNQQSVVRASVAPAFLRNIKLATISGFGPKAEETARAQGLIYVGDVQSLSPPALARLFPSSDKFAAYLADIAAGVDDTPVLVHAAPKSIGQSKQGTARNNAQRAQLLEWLSDKLTQRCLDDEQELNRRATLLQLSWSIAVGDNGWNSTSRRAALPPRRSYTNHNNGNGSVHPHSLHPPPHAEMLDVALKLLRAHVHDGLVTRCVGLGVSNFVPIQTGKGLDRFFGAGTTTHANTQAGTGGAVAAAGTTGTKSTANRSTIPSAATLAAFFSLPSSKGGTAASTSPASGPDSDLGAAASSLSTGVLPHADDDEEEEEEEDAFAAATSMHGDEDDEGASADNNAQHADIEEMFGDGAEEYSRDSSAAPPQPHPLHSGVTAASAAGPSAATACPTSEPSQACTECGQLVLASRASEHADFHFAARVQAELREADRKRREKEQQAAARTAALTAAAAKPPSTQAGQKRKKASSSAANAASSAARVPTGADLRRFFTAPSPPSSSSSLS
jgi:nucleotidyltransferase/DNA polymerase involved in DNA repair